MKSTGKVGEFKVDKKSVHRGHQITMNHPDVPVDPEDPSKVTYPIGYDEEGALVLILTFYCRTCARIASIAVPYNEIFPS